MTVTVPTSALLMSKDNGKSSKWVAAESTKKLQQVSLKNY